jgi:hypothetical protein
VCSLTIKALADGQIAGRPNLFLMVNDNDLGSGTNEDLEEI